MTEPIVYVVALKADPYATLGLEDLITTQQQVMDCLKHIEGAEIHMAIRDKAQEILNIFKEE